MNEVALILAGHGSHISPRTAGIVWDCADRLRRCAAADEITACFWKEPPSFRHALDTIRARQVVVVPVFTARGYFTQTVIPTEMGLDGAVTRKSGKIIHLTPAIGEHPLLDEIVQKRVQDTLASQQLPLCETAVAVIGHGTPRNPQSRDAARRQAQLIRRQIAALDVVDVYLDDQPDIPSIYDSTRAENIIALPYFLASGSHVSQDVPQALGLMENTFPERIKGRNVFYTEPVGSVDNLCDIILALARGTGLPFDIQTRGGAWSGFPKVGQDSLTQALNDGKTLDVGQVRITRHRVSPIDETSDSRPLSSPAALRDFIREAPFRPLPTRRDLPTGWHVELDHPAQAHAVIDTIYPTLAADWSAQKHGRFAAESLRLTAARQPGMFRHIDKLPARVLEKTIKTVCGDCIRQPVWWHGSASESTDLPCKSACNIWLSRAKDMGDRAV